jgi:hypothetical protein
MVDNVLVMSLLGAAVYNGIGYGTATERKTEGYSIFKAARTGAAGIIQTAVCAITVAVVPDSIVATVAMPETIWNGIMVGIAGAFGIDKGLKYIGVK